MANLALLIVSFGMGIILHKAQRFPENTASVLNAFIVHVSLPALTILHVHDLRPDPALVYPILMAWVFFIVGVGFFALIARFYKMSQATLGGLIMTGALGNTSFVGLPMIEAYYGKEGLPIGIIADQMGSFLVLSTLGVMAATKLSSGGVSWPQIIKKIVLFPPFQALAVGMALIPVEFPEWTVEVLSKLGGTLPPLALLSVGFQLRLSHLRGLEKPLAAGLFYKLILGPAILAGLFIGVFGAEGLTARVTIFEAAMPPMITGGIVAMEHGLNPPLAALMVGVGIPLSFITLAGWWWLLQGV